MFAHNSKHPELILFRLKSPKMIKKIAFVFRDHLLCKQCFVYSDRGALFRTTARVYLRSKFYYISYQACEFLLNYLDQYRFEK